MCVCVYTHIYNHIACCAFWCLKFHTICGHGLMMMSYFPFIPFFSWLMRPALLGFSGFFVRAHSSGIRIANVFSLYNVRVHVYFYLGLAVPTVIVYICGASKPSAGQVTYTSTCHIKLKWWLYNQLISMSSSRNENITNWYQCPALGMRT